jgi:hypothetical protein
MSRLRHLSLTPEQRAELIRIRDRDPRPYLREKAAGLLKIAAGESPHAVALHGLLKPRKPDTVYQWLNEYLEREYRLLPRLPSRKRFSP